MKESVHSAFISVMRENLIKKKTIKIDELGSFKSVHIKQYQRQEPDGSSVLMPPIDYVLFTPQKKRTK